MLVNIFIWFAWKPQETYNVFFFNWSFVEFFPDEKSTTDVLDRILSFESYHIAIKLAPNSDLSSYYQISDQKKKSSYEHHYFNCYHLLIGNPNEYQRVLWTLKNILHQPPKFPIRASYNFGIVLKNIKEFQIVSQVLENLHQAPLPQKIS